jgi:hypothetical protein
MLPPPRQTASQIGRTIIGRTTIRRAHGLKLIKRKGVLQERFHNTAKPA